MKLSFPFGVCCLALATTGLTRADTSAPPATTHSPQDIVAQLFSPPAVQDFINQSDEMVDSVDGPQARGGLIEGKTKLGLQLQFTIQKTDEAILYYFAVSRGGDPLSYSDGVKFIAVFGDRCGLPHPIAITQGERDIYYAQWLFQPKGFKKLRKKMLEVRAESRAQKNPMQSLSDAINRELAGRARAHSESNR